MDLPSFFNEYPECALAFSGGTDSSYLLWAAQKYARHVRAYFIKTAFQPVFELEDAKQLAKQLGASLTIIDADILSNETVASNPENRCYFCKKTLFSLLAKQATADGFSVLIDGTNASDDEKDRPGMKALTELQVRSPLRECSITKDLVRSFSKSAELFTWNKPAYACLATRVPSGRTITAELLKRVEESENALFALGFKDFRCRVYGEAARLQFSAVQMGEVLEKRQQIIAALRAHFSTVLLDLADR